MFLTRCQSFGLKFSWINQLTLIPPSGGLYGSQFLVVKLLEVHTFYNNETIIYSIPQVFYADS
jgi:hypothetical protein